MCKIWISNFLCDPVCVIISKTHSLLAVKWKFHIYFIKIFNYYIVLYLSGINIIWQYALKNVLLLCSVYVITLRIGLGNINFVFLKSVQNAVYWILIIAF
jgi:hypothetical protein